MSSGSVSNEAESCTLVPGAESGKWSRLALLDGQVTSIVLMDADAELLRAARTAQLSCALQQNISATCPCQRNRGMAYRKASLRVV